MDGVLSEQRKQRRRQVIGCMTGTSLDGLDAALIGVAGVGLDLSIEVLDFRAFAFPAELQRRLRDAAKQVPMTAGEFAKLGREFGEFHAACLKGVWGGCDGGVDLVAVHGQTVFHGPPDSWQLVNVYPIARVLGCAVIFDLRGADLAGSGEGAPITPLVDALVLGDGDADVGVLNLGGFVNYTRLPRVASGEVAGQWKKIEAGDLCVCNQLLDRVAERLLGEPFDDGGMVALCGVVAEGAGQELVEVLCGQAREGRSLGTGDECCDAWLARWIGEVSRADLLRTICHAIAEVIADALCGTTVVYGAGGGMKNRALEVELLECGVALRPLNDGSGMTGENREAVAMAVLGVLCADGVGITLPGVTGGDAPVSGSWVSGPKTNRD